MRRTFERREFVTPYSLRHPHTRYRRYYLLISTGDRLSESVTLRLRPNSLSAFTKRDPTNALAEQQRRYMNGHADLGGAGDFQPRSLLRHWLIRED